MGMPATSPIPNVMTAEGRIAANLARFVADFARRHRLGVVFAQDTGFKIGSDPDTVRAPNVAFVAQARLHGIPERGDAPLAPDLLAEVVSPGDTPGELLAKIASWLEAGTKLVWVVDPGRAEARVYRRDGSLSLVGGERTLEGEDVLPGFACALEDVLN